MMIEYVELKPMVIYGHKRWTVSLRNKRMQSLEWDVYLTKQGAKNAAERLAKQCGVEVKNV